MVSGALADSLKPVGSSSSCYSTCSYSCATCCLS